MRLEFALGLVLLVLLLASTSNCVTPKHFSFALIATVLGLFVFSFYPTAELPSLVFGLFIDNMAALQSKRLLLCLFFCILLFNHFVTRATRGVLLLLAFSLLAILILMSSSDFFLVFLAIELLALSSYCLVALPKRLKPLEAAIKYFAVGILGASFFLYGSFFYFYMHETTCFFAGPSKVSALSTHFGLVAVCIFILSAFFTKLGVAPFHYWVADVYEGSSALVVVFLAVIVKVSMFLLFVKVLVWPLIPCAFLSRPLLILASGLSIIVGCFGALFQKRIKRLLAYSSINNAGYGLAGLAAGNVEGMQAGLSYIVFYSISLLLVFIIVLNCKSKDGPAITYVVDLKKLGSGRNLVVPIVFSITLFSFAGMPPLTGFWTKFFVLNALVSEKLYLLALVGAVTSVFSSFYYVSLIKVLFFEEYSWEGGISQDYGSPLGVLVLVLFSSLFAYIAIPGQVDAFFLNLISLFLAPLVC
jgi:NADH-quinone oxidoreductase subunit N